MVRQSEQNSEDVTQRVEELRNKGGTEIPYCLRKSKSE